jgi:hypothetical protein
MAAIGAARPRKRSRGYRLPFVEMTGGVKTALESALGGYDAPVFTQLGLDLILASASHSDRLGRLLERKFRVS